MKNYDLIRAFLTAHDENADISQYDIKLVSDPETDILPVYLISQNLTDPFNFVSMCVRLQYLPILHEYRVLVYNSSCCPDCEDVFDENLNFIETRDIQL